MQPAARSVIDCGALALRRRGIGRLHVGFEAGECFADRFEIDVGAFLVFNVIGWLMGAVMFLVKLAIVAAIATVAVKAISSRRSRELGGGRRRSIHR